MPSTKVPRLDDKVVVYRRGRRRAGGQLARLHRPAKNGKFYVCYGSVAMPVPHSTKTHYYRAAE